MWIPGQARNDASGTFYDLIKIHRKDSISVYILLAGKYFGASTSFVRTAGLIEQLFGPERVAQMDYFIKTAPRIDWQWMFVVGIFLGAMISAVTSGSFKCRPCPTCGPSVSAPKAPPGGPWLPSWEGGGHVRGPAGRGVTQRTRAERFAPAGCQRVHRTGVFLYHRGDAAVSVV
ncbi:MAG: YeeE/YedE family protein [Desulfobacterales bacterium]|nr:YeeE/YedE family protein [Desulfobacterales bacterium]